MKKLIAICLVALMCLSVFAACTTTEPETPDTPESSTPNTNESEPKEDDSSEPEGEDTSSTPAESQYDIQAALDYLDNLYKKENIVTAADYELTAQVMIGLDKYLVAWAVDSDKVNAVEGSPNWTIEVDEMSLETVNYKIIATVTAPDGTTGTISYDRTVPKFEVTSFEDYMNAQTGDIVTVAGIVVAINAKSVGNTRNHLFLADVDGKGGYYCYQLDQDPVEAGIEVGMTVAVTAPASPYSGMQETKGGDFVILDKEIKTVEVKDLTDIFANGDLKPYVGLVVTLKGVTIAGQELGGTSEYLKFTLNGKESYIRTYVTDFPTTLKAEDKAAIDAAHAANFGNTADVTGVLVLYSGNPYLIPVSVDCFTNYTAVTKTDAEKVAAEKGALNLPASFTSNAVVDLAAKGQYYDDVTITWALEENAAATLADGKLTLTVPDAETIVKVTATITCGEVTETKAFEIKLSKTITSIKDAMAIGSAKEHNTYTTEKYLIAGIITEIYNAQYGNMYIVDELGNKFTVYGAYSADGSVRFDAMETKPQVGDYVVVLGVLGQYNGTAQTKNAWIQSWTTPTTIPGVLETVKDFTKNQYTDNKVIISGEITEVQNATYGNIVIKDAEGNSILVYGLYSANGATRYDAMETKPAVGDTITVLGIVGKYNDAQMKNGWLLAHTVATTEGGEGNEGTEGGEGGEGNEGEGGEVVTPPATEVITTIAGALAGAEGASVELTGTVVEIYQAWSDQYKNISFYIQDDSGNKILVFRTGTLVGVGDVVTVKGTVTLYNTTNQIAQGATTTIVTAHVCNEFTDADCLNAAKCVVCDKVNGEALGHNYVDGTCSACGATEVTGNTITANKTIASLISELGWTSSTTKQEFNLDDVVTVKINGGSNTGKAYNGDHIRIYATDTPAGTVTISVAEGYELVSVKISAQTGTYAFLCLDGTTTDICNATTAVSGSSVVLNSVKNGSDGKQVRITAIEVVYKTVE